MNKKLILSLFSCIFIANAQLPDKAIQDNKSTSHAACNKPEQPKTDTKDNVVVNSSNLAQIIKEAHNKALDYVFEKSMSVAHEIAQLQSKTCIASDTNCNEMLKMDMLIALKKAALFEAERDALYHSYLLDKLQEQFTDGQSQQNKTLKSIQERIALKVLLAQMLSYEIKKCEEERAQLIQESSSENLQK